MPITIKVTKRGNQLSTNRPMVTKFSSSMYIVLVIMLWSTGQDKHLSQVFKFEEPKIASCMMTNSSKTSPKIIFH